MINLLKCLAENNQRLLVHWSNNLSLQPATAFGLTNFSNVFGDYTYRIKLIEMDKSEFDIQMPLVNTRLKWFANDWKEKFKAGKLTGEYIEPEYINKYIVIQ